MNSKEVVELIKKARKEGKIIYGSNKVLKSLLRGELEFVVVAKNCPWHIKEDLKRYSSLSKVNFFEIDLDNKELGVLIGRGHGVASLGVKK